MYELIRSVTVDNGHKFLKKGTKLTKDEVEKYNLSLYVKKQSIARKKLKKRSVKNDEN